MRGSAVALLVVLLVWLSGSAWWYTCKIKENCISFSNNTKTVSSTLIVNLEGEEIQTFHMKNSSNGIMEFLPGSDGDGLSVIKQYMYENPGQNIDLVTANESQENGLLAMMILSGIPNRRINTYIDPTVGSEDKPLRISSSPIETEIEGIVTVNDTITNLDTVAEVSTEEVAELITPTPEPVVLYVPCPVVSNEGELPEISDILYPTAASSVRCTAELRTFAAAASTVMEANESIMLIVTGHTDQQQHFTNNYQLALKRAVEVKKYFIKHGIPGNRIETYSRGGDQPVADNSTAEGQLANRRVVISWNNQDALTK